MAHLERELLLEARGVELLGERWHIFQGVQTGADAYTGKIQRRLERPDRETLEAAGRRTGEPILELPAGRERAAPWRDVPHLLARSVEPRAILYGALDEDDYTHLVWIGRDDDVSGAVRDALEPRRRVLATRAEFVRNPRRRWFETAWPRDQEKMRRPKVIALHRTDRGRFAVDERGGRTPWHVRRDYEPRPMARIPNRHALLADGRELVERAERLVFRLYHVPPELADEVVAQAVARARGPAPVEG